MKKIIVSLLFAAILLTCCACKAEQETVAGPATEAPSQATLDPMSAEAKFGHIDQTQPQEGVYKVWNAEGVQFMMGLTDAKIELLCDIDMAGATLAPITQYTGELNGGNFTISNFTLRGEGENFGFIAVNMGSISNLNLQQVTGRPGADAKNIGLIAGINEGSIIRVNPTGTLTVETAVGDANCGALVGLNTGSLSNVAATVDVIYTAPGTAKVGSLVGTANGGTVEFLENHGALTVTGEGKTTGLFAGEATDVVLKNCLFGGPDNSLNGKLFVNFTGNPDDNELEVALKGRWRDNAALPELPENVAAVRQKAVDAMHEVCTVPWKVRQDKAHTCNCNLTRCHGVYKTGYTYLGIPYSHKSSSATRLRSCLDEEGYLADWIYELPPFDGLECYIGGDCSSTVQQAWFTVSNSVELLNTEWIPAAKGQGTIAVGPYKCDYELTGAKLTWKYIDDNGEKVMFDSYAAMRYGDIIVNRVEAGGHTRMVVSDPVIVKDQAGNIDGTYSYVLCDENVAEEYIDEEAKTITTCKVNCKYNFSSLFTHWYVPVTCEELLTGQMETPEATLEGACGGYGGMFTGTVRSNYYLDYVELAILDENGNEALNHKLFTTVSKTNVESNYYTARCYVDWLHMSDFATVLATYPLEKGHTYSYTVTAGLATFDQIPVHEGSFTYGT